MIEFYVESQKEDQVVLLKKEFQEVLRIADETRSIFDCPVNGTVDQIGDQNTLKIQKRIENIKTEY